MVSFILIVLTTNSVDVLLHISIRMGKKKWFLFCIIACVLLLNYMTETFPLNLGRTSVPSDFKVLCYNIHSLDTAFSQKQLGVANNILKENPDVVFLCEFYPSKNRKLDSLLRKEYKRYRKSGTRCVFYSRYKIDNITEEFPKWYDRRHSQTVKARVFWGRDTLTIIGCHLSSSHHHIREGFTRRKVEADTLYEHIRKEHYPVIVLGDLNDISGSYTLSKIMKAGLSNAWWEGGCGYGATFHDGWLRLRIDHILYSKERLKLQSIKVIDSDLSDHNALVAAFDIK